MAAYLTHTFVAALIMTLAWPSWAAGERPAVLVNPNARGNGAAQTIQEGIDLVDPGGKVMVLPGVYEENLVIRKGLSLEGIGGASGEVVVATRRDAAGFPENTIQITTTQPVTVRDITVRHRGLNGIRGIGAVNVTVERISATGVDLPLGVGRVISVSNDVVSGAPPAQRATLVVRESSIDGGVGVEETLTTPLSFPQVFGVLVVGDVDAVLERNVIRRTGAACVAVFLRSDLGGLQNVDVLGNDMDECYALGRVGAVITGPIGTLVPTREGQLTGTGTVNIVGNTIRNSTESCLPASAIVFETHDGRIEHNTIVGFVQGCAVPSARGNPGAIAVGSVRPFFPAVSPVVRFNDLEGNAHAGLRLAANESSPIDARCNWWGSDDGPSGDGPGSGDALLVGDGAATPDILPWATGPIAGTGATTCSGGAE